MVEGVRFKAKQLLGRCFRPLLLLILKFASEREVVRGIRVWNAATVRDAKLLFDRITEAIVLIEKYDRLRFRRVRDRLGLILILDTVDAVHLPDVNVCVLGASSVTDIPCSRLAAVIVHEATHARFRAARIPIRKDIYAREEIRCVREAISFLEKVPNAHSEAERMRVQLDSELKSGKPWFNRVFE